MAIIVERGLRLRGSKACGSMGDGGEGRAVAKMESSMRVDATKRKSCHV